MTNVADLKNHYRDRAANRPELSLREILGSSLTRDLMRADHVDPARLAADLLALATDLPAAPKAPSKTCTAGC